MNDHDGTVGDLLRPYLAEQCQVILAAEAQLRAGEPVVHSTRVAVRRLRSTLRTFAEVFDVPVAAWLEEELVWLAARLGEVRDLDILGERLLQRVAELPPELVLGPVTSTIETEIALRRKQRWAEVLEALDSDRWAVLGERLREWRESPPFTAAAEKSLSLAVKDVRRAGKRLSKRLADALAAYDAGVEEAEELLHRARKAGKRHRYAVEALEPVWGKKAAKTIDQRKRLQDLLGDHQDSLVSAAFLREVGARFGNRSGRNGFTFGLLYGLEQASREGLRDRLRKLQE